LLAVFFLLVFSLAPAWADGTSVYIAIRTDGLPGLGTQSDPFDGSTKTKFDTLMQSFPANTQIHIGPGTFMTDGGDGFNLKAGQIVQGAGMGVTILKLAGHGSNGYYKHYHLAGYCSGVQISNLTCDGNYQGYAWPAHDAVGGVTPFGSNTVVDSVEMINCYGDSTNGLEEFSILLGGPTPQSIQTNCVIKNCLTHHYAPGANYTNGPMISYCTGAKIINCTDDGSNHGFGFAGASDAEVTGCTTSRLTNTDFYTDTAADDHITIDENSFSSGTGIPIQFNSASPATDVTISDNALETSNSTGSGSAAIVLSGASGSHFTVTGNVFTYNGTNWSGLMLNNSTIFTDLDVENNSSNVGLIGGGGSNLDITNVGIVQGNHFNEPIASLTPPPGSPGAPAVASDSSSDSTPAPSDSGSTSSNSGAPASPSAPSPAPSSPANTPPTSGGNSSNADVAASTSNQQPGVSSTSTPPADSDEDSSDADDGAPSNKASTPPSQPASTPHANPPPKAPDNSSPDEGSPQQLAKQVQQDTATLVRQNSSLAAPSAGRTVAGTHQAASGTPPAPPVRGNSLAPIMAQLIHDKFLHTGPYGTADYVRSLPEGADKDRAIESLTHEWKTAAPAGAASWLASLPGAALGDSTVRSFSDRIGQSKSD
jgi:hypothetical protein